MRSRVTPRRSGLVNHFVQQGDQTQYSSCSECSDSEFTGKLHVDGVGWTGKSRTHDTSLKAKRPSCYGRRNDSKIEQIATPGGDQFSCADQSITADHCILYPVTISISISQE